MEESERTLSMRDCWIYIAISLLVTVLSIFFLYAGLVEANVWMLLGYSAYAILLIRGGEYDDKLVC